MSKLLTGVIQGIIYGSTIGLINTGDTRSLDDGSLAHVVTG